MKALIVVDVQNDFCPGGALGVEGGDQLGERIHKAATEADVLVATRDCHPHDHLSFTTEGGIWPPHCVADTHGEDLHPSVADLPFDLVQLKGRDKGREQYSGFDGTPLAFNLRKRGVTEVLICGIATDYCVRATALDAIKEGFATTVLADACAAVANGTPALAEIFNAGGAIDWEVTMENPNAYDDGAWMAASDQMESALFAMWEAGGSKEDILAEVEARLENIDA